MRDNISFITNESILPVQFFPDPTNQSGCQRLLMAIFDEALDTLDRSMYMRENHKADVLWNTVVKWILSDDDRYASFTYCCQYLGAEPEIVRSALRAHYGLELRVPYHRPYAYYAHKPTGKKVKQPEAQIGE